MSDDKRQPPDGALWKILVALGIGLVAGGAWAILVWLDEMQDEGQEWWDRMSARIEEDRRWLQEYPVPPESPNGSLDMESWQRQRDAHEELMRERLQNPVRPMKRADSLKIWALSLLIGGAVMMAAGLGLRVALPRLTAKMPSPGSG